MSWTWIFEKQPTWDADKGRIVGGAPAGAFALGEFQEGEPVPGEWWRVERDGAAVGYGWMDTTWNGAEVLLAVDPDQQGRGVGSFILDHLEREAAQREQLYLFNTVRDGHPDRDRVARWLEARGFEGGTDGELRRRVKAGG